jgi:ABC-type transporter Mla subunit MlaD
MAQSNYSSIEIKAGLFLAFCLALFVGMIVIYGRLKPISRPRQEIFVAFENISTLQPDSPVRYNGLEVGRVKWIRVLHLDAANIARLPALSKRDLENLPLRPAAVKRALREAADVDFEPLCREALKNRTMIELCLEVVQDNDARRYRLDDQVRVAASVLGDTAVEISSGSGAINTSQTANLLLGTSGDFFSNLAKSMGDVRTILSNVTDVVGTQERASFAKAQSRMANITKKMDAISAYSSERAPVTVKRIEKLGGEISRRLNESSGVLDSLQPKARQAADTVAGALKDIQDRVNLTQEEAGRIWGELSADWTSIRNTVEDSISRARPDFEQMGKNARKVYDVMGGLSSKLDNAGFIAERAVYQSQSDLRRIQDSFRKSVVNLGHFEEAARENKDLFLSRSDVGEHEYNTAVVIYRHIRLASQRVSRTRSELQTTLSLIQEEEADAEVKSNLVLKQISKSAFVLDNLKEMSGKIAAVLSEIEQRMTPAQPRPEATPQKEPAPKKEPGKGAKK